jgi:hypothetical protein
VKESCFGIMCRTRTPIQLQNTVRSTTRTIDPKSQRMSLRHSKAKAPTAAAASAATTGPSALRPAASRLSRSPRRRSSIVEAPAFVLNKKKAATSKKKQSLVQPKKPIKGVVPKATPVARRSLKRRASLEGVGDNSSALLTSQVLDALDQLHLRGSAIAALDSIALSTNPRPTKRIRARQHVDAASDDLSMAAPGAPNAGTKLDLLTIDIHLLPERKHCVFDVDGTLIDSNATWDCVTPRPGLEQMLDAAFAECASVSVWTAAKREWFDHVWKRVLRPLVEGKGRSFRFVWTQDRCVKRERPPGTEPDDQGNTFDFIKPLRLLWNSSEFVPPFTRFNVFIVDDNPATFVENPHNAVHIPVYEGMARDTAFRSKLTPWLRQVSAASNVRAYVKPWLIRQE